MISDPERCASRETLIIYTSRTHSQLSQVTNELKKTSYRPRFNVVGSRDHLCVNETVKRSAGPALSTVCQQLVSKKRCEFYSQVPAAISSLNNMRDACNVKSIMDIEDLKLFSKDHRACPFHVSREALTQNPDFLVMPYNYLFDQTAFSSAFGDMEISNSVVIIDEAHNVDSVCCDAASTSFSSLELDRVCYDLSKAKQLLLESPSFSNDHYSRFKNAPLKREEAVEKKTSIASKKGNELTNESISDAISNIESLKSSLKSSIKFLNEQYRAPGSYLLGILEKAGINHDNVMDLQKTLSLSARLIIETNFNRGNPASVSSLNSFESVLLKLFRVSSSTDSPNFYQFLAEKYDDHLIFNYWCLSPSVTIKELREKGIKSLLLTSGTLSPMVPLAKEMMVSFPIMLEGLHVVPQENIFCRIINTGILKNRLNGSYENRDNKKYIDDLGCTISTFFTKIPEGVLIFFPSYPQMEKCIGRWKETGHWLHLNKLKPSIFEPRGGEKSPAVPQNSLVQEKTTDYSSNTTFKTLNQSKSNFKKKDNSLNWTTSNEKCSDLMSILKLHKENIAKGRGSALFAVCRGKVSEGIDFSDSMARGVLIVGIPYPPLKDPKIVLKREFISYNTNGCTGDEWYVLQAIRAVNQSIGRVIRHRNDYGAVILLDERFSTTKSISQLPRWLRPIVKTSDTPSSLLDLEIFFQEHTTSKHQLEISNLDNNGGPTDVKEKLDAFEVKEVNYEKEQAAWDSAKQFFNRKRLPPSTISIIKSEEFEKKKITEIFKPIFLSTHAGENDSNVFKAEAYLNSTNIGSNAQDFLEMVKLKLSREQSKEFSRAIKAHRAGTIKIEALIDTAVRIFGSSPDLCNGFRQFIPNKHLPLFNLELSKNQTNIDIEPSLSKESISAPEISTITQNLPPDQELTVSRQQVEKSGQNSTFRNIELNSKQCSMCKKNDKTLFKSRCEHVCCLPCWTRSLDIKAQCPVCLLPVRLPHLKRMI